MTAEEIEMQMPYQKWFWRDWLADQAILMLTPEHRCIWFEMLGLMASSENPGYLETFGVEPELYISFQRRINVKSVKSGMAAIEKLGLFSRDDSGKIYSRRIIREADELQRQLHNGSKGGRPKTQPQNPEPKPTTETPIAIAIAIAKEEEIENKEITITKLCSPPGNDIPGNLHKPSNCKLDRESITEQALLFLSWYCRYPRKVGRKSAWERWMKIKPLLTKEDVMRMIEVLEKQKRSGQWNDAQFVPHPETYLSKGLWDQEFGEVQGVLRF